jgi:hypothetical protein
LSFTVIASDTLPIRLAGRYGAKKTPSRVLYGPEQRSVNSEVVEKVIAALVPEPHDRLNVLGIESA